ncbi:hypothetical protein BDM02DRAFT_3178153 [Thelephora ganbajun]|uniref:Uncharacterized protein n=1 Tax=Thelephora ganbajun TaxID=370292 RepID=A0ACB6ZSS5_THEGA|nr:hypothetical protein BDM02DRAFT_3178153 [Thelephora ganbajun]
MATQKSKVVVTRDLGPDVLGKLREDPSVDLFVWPPDCGCDRNWLLEEAEGAVGLVVTLTDKVDEELLTRAGANLKVVSTMSVGYEHVDLAGLAKRGVRLGYTPDVLNGAVADLSIMLALMAGRNGGNALAHVRNGEWPNISWSPFGWCGPQLSGTVGGPKKTVGFLGFGRIAQVTLNRLVGFEITRCIYTTRIGSPPKKDLEDSLTEKHRRVNPGFEGVRQVDLKTLARESDVLFILAPGGAETRHIVNEELLREMKRTSVLVNTSRGSLVDSDALAKALREGWIWGAGLDVVEGEPDVTADHPLVKQPSCVIVPHIGSATFATRTDMANTAVANVLAVLSNKPMVSEKRVWQD